MRSNNTTIFLAKSKNLSKFRSIKIIEKPNFLNFNTEEVFRFLKQIFIKALIL